MSIEIKTIPTGMLWKPLGQSRRTYSEHTCGYYGFHLVFIIRRRIIVHRSNKCIYQFQFGHEVRHQTDKTIEAAAVRVALNVEQLNAFPFDNEG